MSWTLILKGVVAGLVTMAVLTVGARIPKVGGLVLSLPITSLVVFIALWMEKRELDVASNLARETIVFVALGLVWFVPLAFAKNWGLGFWSAFALGTGAAMAVMAAYFAWASTGSNG